MNMKNKGKVYMTVVRPALVYGAQTRELTKVQENKLEVAEDMNELGGQRK